MGAPETAPTRTRDTDDLYVCTDCYLLLVNGEVHDRGDICHVPSYAQSADDAHLYNLPGDDQSANAARRHAARVHAYTSGADIVPGDTDRDTEFSWSTCDGCGSRLGGSRHHVVAFLS